MKKRCGPEWEERGEKEHEEKNYCFLCNFVFFIRMYAGIAARMYSTPEERIASDKVEVKTHEKVL